MKRVVCMLLSACFLLLTACSASGAGLLQDRFCGFYLTVEDVESEALSDADRAVGAYDEKTDMVSFEGVEGFPCFYATVESSDGNPFSQAFLDSGMEMRPMAMKGDLQMEVNWYLSEDEDRVICPYSVYQKSDGSFYLSRENAAFGAGVDGFYRMGASKDHVSETLSCHVNVKYIVDLETVSVKQFDAQDNVVEATILTQSQWQDSLTLEAETIWLTVEERYADGTVTRTAYTAGEDIQEHHVYFLKEDGMGENKTISFSKNQAV